MESRLSYLYTLLHLSHISPRTARQPLDSTEMPEISRELKKVCHKFTLRFELFMPDAFVQNYFKDFSFYITNTVGRTTFKAIF